VSVSFSCNQGFVNNVPLVFAQKLQTTNRAGLPGKSGQDVIGCNYNGIVRGVDARAVHDLLHMILQEYGAMSGVVVLCERLHVNKTCSNLEKPERPPKTRGMQVFGIGRTISPLSSTFPRLNLTYL